MNEEQIKNTRIDIKEGTIEFWIRENKICWNDSKATVLFNIPVNNVGNLFMVKDDDNKLKFFHFIVGKGRTGVEVDVSGLSTDKPHYIAVTWSVTKKEICLYIDGELKAKAEIKYSF